MRRRGNGGPAVVGTAIGTAVCLIGAVLTLVLLDTTGMGNWFRVGQLGRTAIIRTNIKGVRLVVDKRYQAAWPLGDYGFDRSRVSRVYLVESDLAPILESLGPVIEGDGWSLVKADCRASSRIGIQRGEAENQRIYARQFPGGYRGLLHISWVLESAVPEASGALVLRITLVAPSVRGNQDLAQSGPARSTQSAWSLRRPTAVDRPRSGSPCRIAVTSRIGRPCGPRAVSCAGRRLTEEVTV